MDDVTVPENCIARANRWHGRHALLEEEMRVERRSWAWASEPVGYRKDALEFRACNVWVGGINSDERDKHIARLTIFPILRVESVLRIGWNQRPEERTQDDVCVGKTNVREYLESSLSRSSVAGKMIRT
jgi:hypothetical protein